MTEVCLKCGNEDCSTLFQWILPDTEQGDQCYYEDFQKTHPQEKDCQEDCCLICAFRDCPYKEPFHYHHDDCPSCFSASKGTLIK